MNVHFLPVYRYLFHLYTPYPIVIPAKAGIQGGWLDFWRVFQNPEKPKYLPSPEYLLTLCASPFGSLSIRRGALYCAPPVRYEGS